MLTFYVGFNLTPFRSSAIIPNILRPINICDVISCFETMFLDSSHFDRISPSLSHQFQQEIFATWSIVLKTQLANVVFISRHWGSNNQITKVLVTALPITLKSRVLQSIHCAYILFCYFTYWPSYSLADAKFTPFCSWRFDKMDNNTASDLWRN